ncbi:hypothetical protein PPYR_04760 [Photinus pyralis]|uniref:EF-hand domain-containing protein n=1 Tax=Photinus pyralis TaxID=7054 RepID=A0A5N4AZ18_PHOPY|nr:EF-hand calcium-binding domain-containing protein 1-like [Photinus pyralis]KAB0802574.1 hypothetical protein PPYR_04760 [Photinus pyralis]
MSGIEHMDLSITTSEETRFMNKHLNLIRTMSNKYKSSFHEVAGLVIIYYKFQIQPDGSEKGMTKRQFINFLHNSLDITDEKLRRHILSAIEVNRHPTPILTMKSWLSVMLIFLNGELKSKVNHCFKVYDVFQNGSISKRNMEYFLEDVFIGENTEDSRDIKLEFVDMLLRKLDVEGNGEISRENYESFALENPLGMELLGPCLPSRYAIRGFLSTFHPFVRNVR